MTNDTSHTPITFIIPGAAHDGASRDLTEPKGQHILMELKGELKASVQVGKRRAGGETHRITAQPGEDVVVLHIQNGPSLVLHPLSARDLLMSQSATKRGITCREGETPALELGPNEVAVTPEFCWQELGAGTGDGRDTTRDSAADVVLKVIEVIGLKHHLQEKAATALADHIDGRVDEGIYALRREALTSLKGTPTTTIEAGPAGAPSLVFIHGTFSTTSESGFARLWSHHPEQVDALFHHYDGRVYGLDHATLRRTPIDNALKLVEACSNGSVLHLITHSRGGLVAEVLSRAANLTKLDAAGAECFSGDESHQRQQLESLIEKMHEKNIRIERTVRVACPAHGTLLASQRLDAYISILRWAMTLAGLQVLPELVDFLGGVARERTDPNTLPGLAAMAPNSPLIQWLQKADKKVTGELRVVAGDLKGESVRSWVKSLVADAFFWTDNDLVVQTRSMYGGAPRDDGATFVLERSGESSHFNYFTNPRTARAIINGLLEANPRGWKVVGPLSFAGESSHGDRGIQRAGNEVARKVATKPAVILLPGLMASHLNVADERIWLSWRFFQHHQDLAYPGQPEQSVKPDGLIGETYTALTTFLSSSHEVIPFSSDWRQPLEEQAKQLAKIVDEALEAREANGLPVRLLTHSAGGLLARALQMTAADTWTRLMAREGARVLMLAPPNRGMWAPMQMLSGDETLGNVFHAVGGASWRKQMACFPGILQLQADLLDPSLGLNRCKGWQQLADNDRNQVTARSWWHQGSQQLQAFDWGVPDETTLNQAVRFWEKLQDQQDKDLPSWREKLTIVVGSAPFTPLGFEEGSEGLVYLEAPESGDGRVSYASSLLPNVCAWRVRCEHGKMPAHKDAFEAYKELLETGQTRELERFHNRNSNAQDSKKTVGGTWRNSRPSRQQGSFSPPSRADDLYILTPREEEGDGASTGQPLQITVHNSHLAYVRHPLMLGHYSSSILTGTEALVNQLIGGTMAEALDIGCYPDLPGSHQVFLNRNINRANPLQMARPECAIIVGLGEEGKLSSPELLNSVRMGVLGFAQHWKDRPQGAEGAFELWATLLGSGGSGIDAGQAAQMIAQGVWAANDLLERRQNWPVVASLHLVELYLDRASTALHALKSMEINQSKRFSVSKCVEKGGGGEKRPLDMGYRGAGYDFISALTGEGTDASGNNSTIHYTMDTRRARTEMRAQTSQRRLVEQLVAQASNGNSTDQTIGQTLFKLLVPIEMEAALGGTSTLVLELDQGSAPIPWEMLDTQSGTHIGDDHKPWAIRTKLIRKLKLEDFRQQPRDANPSNHILVIGEPDCEAPRLPGAWREARAVKDKLQSQLGEAQVDSLLAPDGGGKGPKAAQIIDLLMKKNWRIVHISGHGMLPDKEDPRGVVLSDDLYLGPREIKMMRVVPELVFVNCCHLAATSQERLLTTPYNRAKFAASVAEQLIHNGVRCVIAAGWAVSDTGAELFASRFYDALLRGERFIDAIATARLAVFENAGVGDNTWAAYQCYGDPDWVLKREGEDPQASLPNGTDPFVGVVSPSALTLALDALSNSARFAKISTRGYGTDSSPSAALKQQLEELESRFARTWRGQGEVAHTFGMAWEQANDYEKAIQWYKEALGAEDGGATLKSWERLFNLQPRLAWKRLQRADSERQRSNRGLQPEEAERLWQEEISEAQTVIREATKGLELLIGQAGETMERFNLCGAAQKRLAMVERKAGHWDGERDALENMSKWYGKAANLGKARNLSDLFYPGLNMMAAECVLHAGEEGWRGFDAKNVSLLRTMLETKSQQDPDFWSEVGLVELNLYSALASQRLASQLSSIMQGYETLHRREKDPMQWSSVQDQLDFIFPVYKERLQASKPQEVKATQSLTAMVRAFSQPS